MYCQIWGDKKLIRNSDRKQIMFDESQWKEAELDIFWFHSQKENLRLLVMSLSFGVRMNSVCVCVCVCVMGLCSV